MSETTKEELLDFMRKHGPEKVDSITDTDSAIRHFRCTSKIYKEQRNQYKTERDTLIDDLKVLREKNEKLKERNYKLERENKDLHLETNTYFDERLEAIEKYFTLTDHIRLKASANPGEHRYIALVNFIDRLEQK